MRIQRSTPKMVYDYLTSKPLYQVSLPNFQMAKQVAPQTIITERKIHAPKKTLLTALALIAQFSVASASKMISSSSCAKTIRFTNDTTYDYRLYDADKCDFVTRVIGCLGNMIQQWKILNVFESFGDDWETLFQGYTIYDAPFPDSGKIYRLDAAFTPAEVALSNCGLQAYTARAAVRTQAWIITGWVLLALAIVACVLGTSAIVFTRAPKCKCIC